MAQHSYQDLISQLKFNEQGLIPAIIQDVNNNQVLMLGYMNPEAIQKTLDGPHVCFYSRSKQRLWLKGETSGHTQTVKEIRLDCDRDTLLILVEQNKAACHKGYRSCFYQIIDREGRIQIVDQKVL